MNIIVCKSFSAALSLRTILQGAGIPAIAVEISDPEAVKNQEQYVVAHFGNPLFADGVAAVVASLHYRYGISLEGYIAKELAEYMHEGRRDLELKAVNLMASTVRTVFGKHVVAVATPHNPRGHQAAATDAEREGHDPGDEHKEPVKPSKYDGDLKGGFDERCRDEYGTPDAYDSWKAGR